MFKWFKWRFFRLRYYFHVEKLADGRFAVICHDIWMNEKFNASGRMLSRRSAESLCKELKSFKTFKDSHTEEGRDFRNPEVKAWLNRMRKRKIKS